jgi:hypothetical protein
MNDFAHQETASRSARLTGDFCPLTSFNNEVNVSEPAHYTAVNAESQTPAAVQSSLQFARDDLRLVNAGQTTNSLSSTVRSSSSCHPFATSAFASSEILGEM